MQLRFNISTTEGTVNSPDWGAKRTIMSYGHFKNDYGKRSIWLRIWQHKYLDFALSLIFIFFSCIIYDLFPRSCSSEPPFSPLLSSHSLLLKFQTTSRVDGIKQHGPFMHPAVTRVEKLLLTAPQPTVARTPSEWMVQVDSVDISSSARRQSLVAMFTLELGCKFEDPQVF